MANRRTPHLLAAVAPSYGLRSELQHLGERGIDLGDHELHDLVAALMGQRR